MILLALLPPTLAQAQIETEEELKAAVAEGGEITFDSDVEIVLTSPIEITNSVTLDAGENEVTINGEDVAQLFRIGPDVTDVNFVGISFINGTATNGGAVYIGDDSFVTFTECSFRHNKAVGTDGTEGIAGRDNADGIGDDGRSGTGGKPAWGGAIYNLGELTLIMCEFLTNSATGGIGGDGGAGGNGSFQGGNGGNGGSGAAAYAGAIFNSGTLSARDCEFDGNFTIGGDGGAGGGPGSGGFAARPGIGGAGAPSAGAAIHSPGDVMLTNCTFFANGAWGGNSAAGGTQQNGNGSDGRKGGNTAGGAVWSAGTEDSSIENCTFTENIVRGGDGGDGGPGSFTGGDGGNGGDAIGAALCNSNLLFVLNCTFALNAAYGGTNGLAGSGAFAGSDGARGATKGAGTANSGGTLTIRGNLFSTNAPGTNVAKIAGTITDAGYNFSSDKAVLLTALTSRNNIAPKLGVLSSNGGFTKTMAIAASSDARDEIPPELAPDTDQRGRNRPLGEKSDVGAFEYDPFGAPTITEAPRNRVIRQSSTATFAITVDGARPFAFQWSLNGTNLPNATNSTLTLTNVQPGHSGTYTVQVRNSGGTNSATATLYLAPVVVWGDEVVTNVPLSATNLAAISAGGYHMLALRADGTVLGWGAGTTNLNAEPHFGQATPPNLGNAAAVAAGGFHSLALRNDGTVVAWGRNTFGQTNVPANATNILTIAAGDNHSLASSSTDGTVIAWGLNSGGQTNVPARLTNVVRLAAGAQHSVALRADGTVVAWGANSLGQTSVPAGLTDVKMIAAGANHSLALRTNGTVVAWGDNSFGQSNVPPLVTDVMFIAAGANHSLAIKTNGAMVAWGDNSRHQAAIPRTLRALSVDGGQFFSAVLVNIHSLAAPMQVSMIPRSPGVSGLFEFSSQTGVVYDIQRRTDLSATGNWTTIYTTNGSGGRVEFPMPAGASNNSFYRVLAR